MTLQPSCQDEQRRGGSFRLHFGCLDRKKFSVFCHLSLSVYIFNIYIYIISYPETVEFSKGSMV